MIKPLERKEPLTELMKFRTPPSWLDRARKIRDRDLDPSVKDSEVHRQIYYRGLIDAEGGARND